MNRKTINKILCAVIIIVGVILDQISKFLAVQYLKPAGTVKLIDNIFHLTYAENTGAAFSIFEGGRIVFVAVTFVMLAVFAFILFSGRVKSFVGEITVAFIISGGLGNLIDRVLNGFVVDMFYFVPINFPVFNVADIFITCGAVVFIILYLISKGELIAWNSR